MSLPIVGDLLQYLTLAYEFVKGLFEKTYQILVDGFGYVSGFTGFITQTFPFDDSKKTLMLSIIFIAVILGIIVAMSGRSIYTGVGQLDKVEVNLQNNNYYCVNQL